MHEERQDNKAGTVLTKSIWKDAKATQLIQCRNELTHEPGFRTNWCTDKIQTKKTSAVRTTERRTKKVYVCVLGGGGGAPGANGREPGRIESQKRTEGGRGKERGFTQRFWNKYFSSNRERNKKRRGRKEGAEDGDARYGRWRGLDPLSPDTKNGEN